MVLLGSLREAEPSGPRWERSRRRFVALVFELAMRLRNDNFGRRTRLGGGQATRFFRRRRDLSVLEARSESCSGVFRVDYFVDVDVGVVVDFDVPLLSSRKRPRR